VNELGERMQAKLEHDICPVGLDRPDGNSQFGGNLLIRFPFRQKSNYFYLAGIWPGR
jgi:hypothetical protein